MCSHLCARSIEKPVVSFVLCFLDIVLLGNILGGKQLCLAPQPSSILLRFLPTPSFVLLYLFCIGFVSSRTYRKCISLCCELCVAVQI